MAYTRTYTIDAGPGGDTVKTAVATKLDGDLTNAFTYLNAHDIATTGVHGFTGAKTGSGAMVGATSPTLVTPVLGVATATSINKVAITAPATSATLTISDGKTLSCTHTLTFSGTDGTTMTFPTTSATLARTDAANTFTGHQTIEGVTSTGATGTGKLVFDTSPTFTTQITTPVVLAPAASLVLKPTTDGATAIQLADKDGNVILNVDTTNNRVGIGTVAPGFNLSVGDGTAERYIKIDGAAANDVGILLSKGGSNKWNVYVPASSSQLKFSSDSSKDIIFDGSTGDAWFSANVSALSFTDRTPYPSSLELAYDAVQSMQPLPEGQYQADNKEMQLDHSVLHPYLKGESENTRDLSASVSVQNIVIQDLVRRIEELEAGGAL